MQSLEAFSNVRFSEMHQVDLRFVMIDDLRKATDPSELRALVRNIDRIKGSLSAYYVQAPSFLAPLILQLEPGEFRDVILISIMNGLQLFEQKVRLSNMAMRPISSLFSSFNSFMSSSAVAWKLLS